MDDKSREDRQGNNAKPEQSQTGEAGRGCRADRERELFRLYPDGPRVFATGLNGLGIDVDGSVIVAPVQAWHACMVEASKHHRLVARVASPSAGAFPGKEKIKPLSDPDLGTKAAKHSGRAEVVYRETGDAVEVVSLQGFLSLAEIQDRYGSDVLNEYRGGRPYMHAGCVGVYICPGTLTYSIAEKTVELRSDFLAWLQLMRECGTRLSKIVKASRESKLITAEI